MDGITDLDIVMSLSPEFNRQAIFKAGQGAGKSNSFFFFSNDKRFIIKTLRPDEKKVLFKMIDDMVDYIIETKNSSLLARIYGVFTIESKVFTDMDVILMQNTTRECSKNVLSFDLKGSKINRKVFLPSFDSKFWH